VTEAGRSAVRGVVAAMAMTGLRRMTTGLGLLRQPPPDLVAEEAAPGLFGRVPPERREEAIELAHWAFGAAAGAVFGLLPDAARRPVWAGPAYGVGIWLGFETAVAPALGLSGQQRWGLSDRAALVADHVLYGLVVAGRPEGA
jgi:hypothetical protein